MASPINTLAPGVVNAVSAPGTAKVPGATRAKTTTGPVTVMTDQLVFPGPQTNGTWVVASFRVFAGNIPVVNQASVGTSFAPPPTPVVPGPMTVISGDPRVKGM